MESLQLYLNSSNADKYLDNSKSHCEWILPMIEIQDGYHIYLSVQNCVIPYSFYNINSSNNKLIYFTNYQIIPTEHILTIPEGNYNINQLVSTLKSLMINFNITYNNINNKITFIYDKLFMLSKESTILEIIGFMPNTIYSSDLETFTLTSVNNINMHPIKCINIVSNLMTYNINKSFVNNNSILCCIPINSQPYSLIEYHNNNNFRVNLFVNTISTIRIKLIDDNGNLLNLNGLNFSLTIQLDIEAFRD
jgi:hypothetical protein